MNPDAGIATLLHVAASSATRDRLQLYLDAEAKILGGQMVRMGERQLQMADLAEVRKMIAVLQAQADREDARGAGRGGRFSQADFSRACR